MEIRHIFGDLLVTLTEKQLVGNSQGFNLFVFCQTIQASNAGVLLTMAERAVISLRLSDCNEDNWTLGDSQTILPCTFRKPHTSFFDVHPFPPGNDESIVRCASQNKRDTQVKRQYL